MKPPIPPSLYRQAIAICRKNRSFGLSLLERELRCGYGECARLVEKMKRRGVAL